MNILISGAGIAGPTLAYWLLRHGFTPTLVERAPRLRRGGYVVDFWGAGFEVAARMGLADELKRIGYDIREVRTVDARGHRVSGFRVDAFREMSGGRYTSIARGDLAAAIWRTLGDRVETLFGDHVASIDEDDGGVLVRFAHAGPRRFDLVIGADGLHSGVRGLAFGPRQRFELDLGYSVAAFEADGYRPRDELVYVGHGAPGRQIARFSMRDDRTMFLFVFAGERAPAEAMSDADAGKRFLHRQFDGAGWECAGIMAAMDRCRELYFDRVSQIRMDTWSKGRVALVGDAAACPSLLAGEGSSLAMTEAYVLAGELRDASGDHALAFRRYEQRLRGFIGDKQRAARKSGRAFAPRSAFGVFVRNQVMRTFAIPAVARWFVARSLADHFELPDYPGTPPA